MKRRWLAWTLAGIGAIICLAIVGAAGVVAFLMVNFPDPPTSALQLPTGGQVDLIGVHTAAGESPFWEVEYRTRIPLSDRGRLAEEVAAVWAAVEPQAKQSGAGEAVIRPVSFSRRVVFEGWNPAVLSHESTAFSFVLAANGSWRRAQGWPTPKE